MKSLIKLCFLLALPFALLHFGLAGCTSSHVLSDDDRLDNAKGVELPVLLSNTDTYHDQDVRITGKVSSVNNIPYSVLLIRQFMLRAENGATITVFVPRNESVPKVGRSLTIYGKFEQRPFLSYLGLSCTFNEYYRHYDFFVNQSYRY